MRTQSAVAVADEVEDLLARTREFTVNIDTAAKTVAFVTPTREIGNGNEMVWNVGIIPGFTVEIDLIDPDEYLTLASRSHRQVSGSSKVRGVIALMGAPPAKFKIRYKVYLRNGGTRTQLKHVKRTEALASLLSNPCLVIDRMGDPPDPAEI